MKILSYIVLGISFLVADLVEYKAFNEALKDAKKDNKIIMIMYSQSDCFPCKIMQDETFEDVELSVFINENLHCVNVNISNNEKLRGFNVRGTPTFYFMDKNKKILKRVVGALSASKIKKIIVGVLNTHKEG